MEKVTFFNRQESLRRVTILLLILTVIGAIGTACLGGVMTGLTHYQLATNSSRIVEAADLQAAFLVGAAATFALTLVVVVIHLIMQSVSRNASRRFFRARALDDERKGGALSDADRRLMNVVEEVALAAATPTPEVFVLDDDASINSFALSRGARGSIIGITAGAISGLERDELQAMIAHEIAHITNGDAAINIRLLALIRGFRWLYDLSVAVIGFPLRTFSSFKIGFMLTFYLAIMFGVFFVVGLFGVGIARLMQAAIARQREYLADATAIQFTRNTLGLRVALHKAGQYRPRKKHHPTHTAAFMMFVSPYRARSWLLRTHPKIEERIEAACAMTPGSESAIGVN